MKIVITVIKKELFTSLNEKYLKNKENAVPCEIFNIGDTFTITSLYEIPKEFCNWAYNDIYKYILSLATGGSMDNWYSEKNTWIVSCTDGLRPVVFEIKRVE